MRRQLIASFVLLLFPVVVSALPPQRDGVMRHYILESAVPLDAAASAALASEGIDVQRPLANHRYLVRMREDGVVPSDARIHSMRAYDASHKIARSAYAEAASGKSVARLRVIFQPDVTFADAQNAIDAAGGTVETPFALSSNGTQRMTVRLPSMSMTKLAEDERVFGVYGPPLRPKSTNAVAALVSNVTPLFSAPYNLTGDGVVLSVFEPDGPPDTTHKEFGGRVTNHFAAGRTADKHATHVSGTMLASGVNPSAKGMAPAATLHAFDANVGTDQLIATKGTDPVALGSVADNNSWDYGLSWQGNEWWGNEDAFGAYSALESEPYDRVMRSAGEPLILHAAGNDADLGNPSLTPPWFPHTHLDDTPKEGTHTFCYSQNGSGTDCVAPPCSSGPQYCETTKHPTHGANTTIGLMASTKNSLTVGALNTDGATIASFSSLGPTTDGRVKPEVVAKGVNQFSTIPGNSYTSLSGTSMSTPVVTGIAGLLTQQYRKTFGKTPSAPILKTLIIAGADDIGTTGPDYTFGFGVADAKASADLIVADAGTGSRIRTGTLSNGQDIDIPIALPATPKFRVVLGWFDPEVLLVPDPTIEGDDPTADKTLINDLDLRVIDPSGATVLPYVLNAKTPSAVATRGVNHTDTTEEIEISNAVAGTYHVIVHGAIGDTRSTTQDYVVVMSAGTAVSPCTDSYEPNDTQATAFGNLVSGRSIAAKICSAADVDYYTFTSNSLSPTSVLISATDTPLKVTLSSALSTTVSLQVPVGTNAKLDSVITTLTSPTPSVPFFVRVEANGTVGTTGAYTLTPTFTYNSPVRKHSAKH